MEKRRFFFSPIKNVLELTTLLFFTHMACLQALFINFLSALEISIWLLLFANLCNTRESLPKHIYK